MSVYVPTSRPLHLKKLESHNFVLAINSLILSSFAMNLTNGINYFLFLNRLESFYSTSGF